MIEQSEMFSENAKQLKIDAAKERALVALRAWAKVQFPGVKKDGNWAYDVAGKEVTEAAVALVEAEK